MGIYQNQNKSWRRNDFNVQFYDEHGNEYDIVPITFEANVANWDDEYREITDSDPTSSL